MQNQRGQILLVIILVVIVGIVLFTVLPKLFQGTPKIDLPSSPVFQGESTISPQKEQEEKEEISSPVIPPAPDKDSPYRSNPQPQNNLPAQTRRTTLSLETDEKAVCRYSTVSGVAYDYMQHTFTNTNDFFHSTLITTLSEGQAYEYYVKCIDEQGNKNTDDFMIAFEVREPEDLTPPVRTNQYPTGDILHYDTKETIIGISTNEPADCRYDTEQGTSYSSMKKKLTDDGTEKYHTSLITGLEPGQRYNFFVRCQDLAGNANTGDVMISFDIGE